MKQIKNSWLRFRPFKQNKPRLSNESGQSLILLAFAFIGLIALLGLALDLGLVYVERIRIKRTVDAASLAAVAELPIEEEAIQRAIEYLAQNGYDVANSNIYVAGCVRDLRDTYSPGGTDDLINLPSDTYMTANAPSITSTLPVSWGLYYPYSTMQAADAAPNDREDTSFYIDTRTFQSREDPLCEEGAAITATSDFGSANRIRVYGQVPVRMNFMQFFGFSEVMVSNSAVAENASSLDVVVVLDTTGSMAFDTICFGCWARCDQAGVSCGADTEYSEYPSNGRSYPYDYSDPAMQNLICGSSSCGGSTIPPNPVNAGGTGYIIMEAEFYTGNNSVWDPAFRPADRGYWAMQRYPVANASSIDGRSGYVRHHPYLQTSDTDLPFGHRYLLTEITDGTKQVPRLDYNFIPTWSGNTYIHLKTQYYATGTNDNPDNEFFWGIDRLPNTQVAAPQSKTGGGSGGQEGSNAWAWISLPAQSLQQNSLHRLKIWAGSPAYSIDRIVVTNQAAVNSPIDMQALAATPGSAQGLAADPCNVIFGLNVDPTDCTYATLYGPTNNLNDPLFGDRQPLRGAQQSVRAFVTRLDPTLDQAGFVSFAANATQRAQLECLRASRARDDVAGSVANYPGMPGIDHDERNCNDPDLGTTPISYTLVFKGIEDAWPPNGNTDIADGLRRGLHMLGVTTDDDGAQTSSCVWTQSGGTWEIGGQTQPNAAISDHCDRGQAATPLIVLLTDGAPTNNDPGDNDDCKANHDPKPYETYGLRPALYEDSFTSGEIDRYDCIIYYTEIAKNKGILIYTIGLGAGADPDLLDYVASRTNGQYYFAPSAAQLNLIFDQILANVYIRLLQ